MTPNPTHEAALLDELAAVHDDRAAAATDAETRADHEDAARACRRRAEDWRAGRVKWPTVAVERGRR
ncbi:MAG: hypothetical protein RLZZ501_1213 [Pseudomonadota bacterium]|jgi:hypothetical protein